MNFLNSQQLYELTNYKRPSAQIRWFAERNWTFEVGADGYPRVDKRYYDKRMMGEIVTEKTKPNITALRAICGQKEKDK